MTPGARFSKLPVITGPVKLFSFPFQIRSFENYTIKLLAKETKRTSLKVRTHPTFLETSISKYDFGPLSYQGFRETDPRSRIRTQATLVGGARSNHCATPVPHLFVSIFFSISASIF